MQQQFDMTRAPMVPDAALTYWALVFAEHGLERYITFDRFIRAPQAHLDAIIHEPNRPLLPAQVAVRDREADPFGKSLPSAVRALSTADAPTDDYDIARVVKRGGRLHVNGTTYANERLAAHEGHTVICVREADGMLPNVAVRDTSGNSICWLIAADRVEPDEDRSRLSDGTLEPELVDDHPLAQDAELHGERQIQPMRHHSYRHNYTHRGARHANRK